MAAKIQVSYCVTTVVLLILILLSSDMATLTQERYHATIIPGQGNDICPSTSQARMNIQIDVHALLRAKYEVFDSCNNISLERPSGYYYIRNSLTGDPVLNYCDMSRTSCCGRRGGWMRVANVDMTDPNQRCPSGLQIWTHPYNTSFNRRLCDRTDISGNPDILGRNSLCNSTTFYVNGVHYSRVYGRIKAYQFSAVNAFSWYAIRGPAQTTIDVTYVDGISLTHGSPRQHIWSFAAGIHEASSDYDRSKCPCASSTATLPPFVGQDYFCESGARTKYNN